MNEYEYEILRRILIAEEDYASWYPWHCNDRLCHHHMCKVRIKKMDKLRYKLGGLYVRLRAIRKQRRLLDV